MATELLSFGIPYILKQNVIYALPARRTRLSCFTPGAVIELSNNVNFAEFQQITGITGRTCQGGFIRNSGPDSQILLSMPVNTWDS